MFRFRGQSSRRTKNANLFRAFSAGLLFKCIPRPRRLRPRLKSASASRLWLVPNVFQQSARLNSFQRFAPQKSSTRHSPVTNCRYFEKPTGCFPLGAISGDGFGPPQRKVIAAPTMSTLSLNFPLRLCPVLSVKSTVASGTKRWA
jgi:hypothetical protein